MAVVSSQWNISSENLDHFRSIGVELRNHLNGAKRLVDGEIRTYPTPIPRCDAQFNYLYEQRLRLSQFLDRVNTALTHDDGYSVLVNALAEFVACPPFSDSVAEQQLRERLRAELARPNLVFDRTPKGDASLSPSGPGNSAR